MTTLRFGLKLGSPIRTLPNGAVASLTVSGNTGPYQIDPANGAVYFTSVDEDRTITVNAQCIDGNGVPFAVSLTAPIGLVEERSEEPILIDQAVNESALTAFVDPFDAPATRRPGLLWMLWSSTRGGGPDLYLQSIAPRYTPLVAKP